jgi:hypothetical protein
MAIGFWGSGIKNSIPPYSVAVFRK